jgi:hypothetical protein
MLRLRRQQIKEAKYSAKEAMLIAEGGSQGDLLIQRG